MRSRDTGNGSSGAGDAACCSTIRTAQTRRAAVIFQLKTTQVPIRLPSGGTPGVRDRTHPGVAPIPSMPEQQQPQAVTTPGPRGTWFALRPVHDDPLE